MEQLTTLLEKLAEKLGTTAEYLWEVLVKQAEIQANFEYYGWIISLVIGIVFFLLTVIAFIGGINSDSYDGEMFWVTGWVSLVVVVIMAFVARAYLLGYYTCISNPEYWALKELFNN